ncbi:hypothetical protein [Rugamonas sp.]|uniref:hypothetical protein n=1 Tax=Rugamonas sp. TaxID=1926287 RepID=UPI0025E9A3F8|nr:hypothetical protein [Rugamonas sp.]
MYHSAHQFEPLLQAAPPSMTAKAADIVRLSNCLGAMAHPATLTALRELLRSMNSYYSNRIEGHSRPELYPEAASKPL